MPRRSPNSARPTRTQEVVAARHAAIQALWEIGFLPDVIAQAVGLKWSSTVYRHIDNDCRCSAGKPIDKSKGRE